MFAIVDQLTALPVCTCATEAEATQKLRTLNSHALTWLGQFGRYVLRRLH